MFNKDDTAMNIYVFVNDGGARKHNGGPRRPVDNGMTADLSARWTRTSYGTSCAPIEHRWRIPERTSSTSA
eukprot:9117846-Heterocapsa_arctica.AAC.1